LLRFTGAQKANLAFSEQMCYTEGMEIEVLDAIDTKALPSVLAQHELEIREMLCSGWTPIRVHRFLKAVRSVEVPLQDISDYLGSIPKAELLDFTALQKRYNQINIQVDAMGELARLLRLTSDRLGAALMIEEASGTRLAYVDTVTASYWKMLSEYVEIQQSIGELPSTKGSNPPVQPGAAAQLLGGKPLPSLRSLLLEVKYGPDNQRPPTNPRGSTT